MWRWTTTSSYDIYMVDTPKENNGDEAIKDNPLGKQSKHGRHWRRPKPRHSNTDTGDENNLDGAEDEYNYMPSSRPDRKMGRLAQMNRRRTDTWRRTITYLPPKTR